MIMARRHLIDTAVFDMDFDSQETAYAAQAGLDDFIRHELITVVDEVFEAAAPEAGALRIPELTLDLGEVPYAAYRDELPRRLRQRLEAWLAEHLSAQTGQSREGASYRRLSHTDARRERLEFFLLHGHLPWYAEQGDGETLASWLHELIADQPGWLAAFVRASPHPAAVIERLGQQFGPATADKLLSSLAPAHAGQFKTWMDEIGRLWRHLSSSPGVPLRSAAALRLLLWQQLILVLLAPDSGRRSAAYNFEQALRVSLSPDSASLAQGLWTAARQQRVDSSLMELLARLAQHTVTERQAAMDGHEAKSPAPPSSDQTLAQAWGEALGSGDFSAIRTVWPEWLAHHAPLLLQTLRQQGVKAEVRRRMASGFPEPVLRDLLGLIEAREKAFVVSVLDRPEWLAPKAALSKQSEAVQRSQLWEFTLAYLLVERGSRFNKTSYLGSLLRQMATAQRLSRAELLANLTAQMAGLPQANATVREMLQLLGELDTEGGAVDADSSGVDDIYRHYDGLRLALDRGAAVDAAALTQAIAALARQAPWLLLRLWRELQAGDAGHTFAAARLPAPALHQWLLAMVRMINGDGAGHLLEAIDAHAGRVADERHYYYLILDRLLAGALIDFEAIVAQAPVMAADTGFEPAPVLESPPRPVPLADEEQALVEYLRDHAAPAPARAAALIQAFEHMLQRRPQRLRGLLSGATAAAQIGRLATLLPERLLVGGLALMGVAQGPRLLQLAELLATACLAPALGLSPRQATVIKWESLYAYVADVGPVFKQAHLIDTLVAGMKAAAVPRDERQFNAMVVQQLLANGSSGSDEITQALVQGLQGRGSETDVQVQPAAAEARDVLDTEALPLEDVYIWNAGLVLATPYLPRLFQLLGLTEDAAFKQRQAAVRGVHMLQYLVTGSLATPEYQLVLNKLLCGVKTGIPIAREIELSPHEREQLDGLLQGMIHNWKALGNTSIQGLREAFLQREGRLQLKDDAWQLRVEARPYDMLLDQLPWGYTTIKYPWMERVIYVEWRS